YYYIFAPAGGVATGWQLVLRSKDIFGPYQEKVTLEQGSTSTNGPHQGAWVDAPDGTDWFVHVQDVGAYGRIVHLQPMQWHGDWPQMGRDLDGNGIGEPVSSHRKPVGGQALATRQESDEFDSDALGLQWQWQANPNPTWYSLIGGRGFLRLFTVKKEVRENNIWNSPNLLLQKFPATDVKATTLRRLWNEEAERGWSAGVSVLGLDSAPLTLATDAEGYVLRQTLAMGAKDNKGEEIIEEIRVQDDAKHLQVEVKGPGALCQF